MSWHLKKSFKPDIIFIDYLNICASFPTLNLSGNINYLYTYKIQLPKKLRGFGQWSLMFLFAVRHKLQEVVMGTLM